MKNTEKWSAEELIRRRRAAELFLRGEEPVTRNELLEILGMLDADIGVVNAVVILRDKWRLNP